MNTRDMLRELCKGHSCNKCKVNEYGINCVAIDKGVYSEDDSFAVEQLFYEAFPEHRPVNIFEDDIMDVFK